MQCRSYVGVACVNGSCPMTLRKKSLVRINEIDGIIRIVKVGGANE